MEEQAVSLSETSKLEFNVFFWLLYLRFLFFFCGVDFEKTLNPKFRNCHVS